MRKRSAGKPANLEEPLSIDHRTARQGGGVAVATVRYCYYQSRGLLRMPAAKVTVQRIGFIKRAQVLDFTLDKVRSLLGLEDGRNRRAIQSVAQARLD